MHNYMLALVEDNVKEIYELFGNLITIDDIETRNLILFGLIINSKILIEIIDDSKIGTDVNIIELKSIKITKDRLIDLLDRCEIIIEKKNIKNVLKQLTKLVIGNDKDKYEITPNITDIYFINTFIKICTSYDSILHLDDYYRNILLFIRKSYLYIAKSMIENSLTDKDLNNSNCFGQKRDLLNNKELVVKSINFVELILKKGMIKNISGIIYKMAK